MTRDGEEIMLPGVEACNVSCRHMRKRKAMVENYASDRLSERLMQILYDSDPRICVYVYRLIDGKPIKPYLYKTQPFEKLETYIAKTFGDGAYYLMIRRGEKMLLSGVIRLLMRLHASEHRTAAPRAT